MTPSSPLRLAVMQAAMSSRPEANTAAILSTLTRAQQQGAALLLTPELSLSGFHSGVDEQARAQALDAHLDAVALRCAVLGVAAAVGLPAREEDRFFNRYVIIDRSGRRALTQDKVGLTPSEATFFTSGERRPVVELEGPTISPR